MTPSNPMQRREPAPTSRLERQLDELRNVHARLLGAMSDLDGITSSALCDDTFRHVRFRLSAVSLARRRLWQEIFRTLEPLVGKEDSGVLNELQLGDLQMLRLSAQHIGTWTSHAVEARWPEYAQASREIRSHMAEAIGKEQRLLYPLLEKYARRVLGARAAHAGRTAASPR